MTTVASLFTVARIPQPTPQYGQVVAIVCASLAWLLAALVAQSRVLLGIHSFAEIVAGSVLGILTTLTIHLVFR